MHTRACAALLFSNSTSVWLAAQVQAPAPAAKPQPMHRVGGPGHTYDETVSLLKAWAAKYPDLIELDSVGQSLEGREIWQLTIANKKRLKHTDRPALFIEGGRHAGEISGIEATLYFINHVLARYGTDPEITALVDTKTVYARPMNNPDGSSLYI